jgi:hypothetical protein
LKYMASSTAMMAKTTTGSMNHSTLEYQFITTERSCVCVCVCVRARIRLVQYAVRIHRASETRNSACMNACMHISCTWEQRR